MTETQKAAIAAIEEQQKKISKGTAPWCCAEQMMDICRNEPDSAELILKDLAVPEMSVTNAEKKIKAYADKHKSGNFSFVSPQKADEIIRKFYGLKTGTEQEASPEPAKIVNVLDFL